MLIFFSCQTSLSHLEHWNSIACSWGQADGLQMNGVCAIAARHFLQIAASGWHVCGIKQSDIRVLGMLAYWYIYHDLSIKIINHDVPQFDSVCSFIVFPLRDSSKNWDPPNFTQQFWVCENSNKDHIPNSHGFGEHGQVAFGWIYQFIEIT